LHGRQYRLSAVPKGSDHLDIGLLIKHGSQTFAQKTVVFNKN
jgi:hypothetical protein